LFSFLLELLLTENERITNTARVIT